MDQYYIAAEATSSEYVDAVKERGIGTLAPTAAPPLDFRPETRKFTEAFKKRWGKEPEEWSPVYYDVVYALAAAIEHAGTPIGRPSSKPYTRSKCPASYCQEAWPGTPTER